MFFFFTPVHEEPLAMKKKDLFREGWFPKIPYPAEAKQERSWL
jgi:hypothetical protein